MPKPIVTHIRSEKHPRIERIFRDPVTGIDEKRYLKLNILTNECHVSFPHWNNQTIMFRYTNKSAPNSIFDSRNPAKRLTTVQLIGELTRMLGSQKEAITHAANLLAL